MELCSICEKTIWPWQKKKVDPEWAKWMDKRSRKFYGDMYSHINCNYED